MMIVIMMIVVIIIITMTNTFIGHPKGDKAGKILVLAHSGEVGQEVDADECAPTDRSNPQRGREYRLRYFTNHPGGLEGNP
jgi:hypothetical protein